MISSEVKVLLCLCITTCRRIGDLEMKFPGIPHEMQINSEYGFCVVEQFHIIC